MLVGMVPTAAKATEPATTEGSEVSVEGTNSFGNLISDALAQAEQEQETGEENGSGGYGITALTIEGNVATVTYEAMEEATLLVAIYTEDGMQLVNSGKTTVSADATQAQVTLEGQSPDYYEASAFLLDSYDLSPLCPAYSTPMYTQEMQALLASTVSTYEEDGYEVLNLDEDETTNFAVYNKSVVVIDYVEGYNTVTTIDDENYTYVIENCDEQITGLSVGTIMAYSYDNNILMVKISDIAVINGTATITGQEMEIEEVFSYLKLETGNDTGADIVVDDSTCDEGVTFEGIVTEGGPATRALEDNVTLRNNLQFSISAEFMPEGDNQVGASIKGSLNLLPSATLSYYISTNRKFVELTLDMKFILSVAFTGSLKSTGLTLGYFMLPSPVPGIEFECKPKMIWQFDITAQIDFTFTNSIGIGWDSKKGFQDLSKKSLWTMETQMDGKLFIGVEIESSVNAIKALKLGFTARGGVQFTGKMGGTDYDGEPKANASKIHTCKSCLAVSVDRVIQVSIWLKLLCFKAEYVWPDRVLHLGDLHWTLSPNDPNIFGKCPRYEYRVNIKVQDYLAQPVADQEVLIRKKGEEETYKTSITDEKGIASVYLPKGSYVFYTDLEGVELDIVREVKNATRVVLTNNPDILQRIADLGSIVISSPKILVNSLFSATQGGEGTFDSGVTWKIYRSGVMVIEGDGAMNNYTYNNVPWRYLRDKIKAVEFRGEITNVGNYAFADCPNLKTVILSDTAKTIGEYAFSGCTGLTEIRLPVDYSYSQYSFSGLSGVEKVQYGPGENGWMPNRQTNYRYAYYDRYSLEYACKDSITTVILEEGIENIGSYAFQSTGALKEVYLAETITTIGIYAFANSGVETIELPETVTHIGNYAFTSSALKEIYLPDSLEGIGEYAFQYCTGITEIAIPNHLGQEIGAGAFQGCSGLQRVTVPADYVIAASPYNCFDGCYNVTEIHYIPGESGVLTSRNLNGVRYSYYWYCSLEYICRDNLKTVIFDEGITAIGNYAFAEDAALEYVELPSTLLSIGQYAFSNASITNLNLPESLTNINAYAFSGAALTQIELPDTLESIGDYAFQHCTGLTEIVIPNHLGQEIGAGAFYGCTGLRKVTVPADYMIAATDSCFAACYNVTEIRFTPGETGVLPNRNVNGVRYSYYRYNSLEYICRENLKKVTLDEGIVSIGYYAFSDDGVLESVQLPSTLTTIGQYAFSNAGITKLTLPVMLTNINAYAFSGAALTQIELPDTLESIGDYAFQHCTGLTEIVIPNHLGLEIGAGTFYNCIGLKKVTVPVDYYIAGTDSCFGACYNVTEIHFTPGETGVMTDRNVRGSGYSYYRYNSLEYISRANLETVTFDEGVTVIGSYAFYDCTVLETVNLPATLQRINSYAFYNAAVTHIDLPIVLSGIGSNAFGYSALETVLFTGDPPVINDNAFIGVTAAVYYPEGNDGWTDDKQSSYGGTLTWESYTPAVVASAEETVSEETPTTAEAVSTSVEEPETTSPAVTTDVQTKKPAQKGVFSGQYSSVEIEEKVVHTAAFAELVPGAEYVVIAIIDPAAEDILALSNLLAIRQSAAGEDGSLMADYIQRQAQDVSYVFAAGATHRNLNNAVITFPLMTENSQPQDIQPTVVYNGKELLEEVDYVIVGDVDYTDAGEYICYIRGVRDYTGLVECRYTVAQANVNAWNVTLGDNVAVNFRLAISDAIAENVTATVAAAGKTETVTSQNAKKDAATGEWLFTVELAAAQMTEEISVEVTDGETQVVSKTYSVREYADYILDDANGFDETTKALVTQMLHYGGAAQAYFGCNTENFANTGIDAGMQTVLPEEDPSPLWVGDYPEGWSLYGVTMLFESHIALRFYYTADAAFTLTVNGKTLEPKEKNGMYYVQVDDIAPHRQAEPVQLQVNGTTCVVYSPINYIIRMHQKTEDAALQQLLLTMYRYHLAALDYCA